MASGAPCVTDGECARANLVSPLETSVVAAHADRTSLQPSYKICPGDRLEVEVVQPNSARALAIGQLDRAPVAAGWVALRITASDAQVKPLPRAA
jgi:hypothetical protein